MSFSYAAERSLRLTYNGCDIFLCVIFPLTYKAGDQFTLHKIYEKVALPCPPAVPLLMPIEKITIKDKSFVPFIPPEAIQNRITQLAQQINEDYAGKQPLVIGILNGTVLFAADLLKKLSIPCEIAFVRVSSYAQTSSTGAVKQILGLSESVKDRDLIVVEDIVDTGLTINDIRKQLLAEGPASLTIATLLHKPEALKQPVELQYVGFEIENKFVVGYGLDYDGLGRNTAAIYVLSE